jgi:hypothetical protein
VNERFEMKNETNSQQSHPPTAPVAAARPAVSRPVKKHETVEEAIARTRNLPSLLDELGPEKIAWIQREAAKHPEVSGYLPPIKQQKQKKKR